MSAPEEVVLLREVTREAHEALRDLRQAMKEAKELLNNLAGDRIEKQISEEVQAGLKGYKETLEKATDAATQAVYKRFDTIGDILLGKGKPVDFEEIAHRMAAESRLNEGK